MGSQAGLKTNSFHLYSRPSYSSGAANGGGVRRESTLMKLAMAEDEQLLPKVFGTESTEGSGCERDFSTYWRSRLCTLDSDSEG